MTIFVDPSAIPTVGLVIHTPYTDGMYLRGGGVMVGVVEQGGRDRQPGEGPGARLAAHVDWSTTWLFHGTGTLSQPWRDDDWADGRHSAQFCYIDPPVRPEPRRANRPTQKNTHKH